MAIQTINIGNVVNDGLGDDLRTAFQKVNANFTELESSLTITASNTGSGGVGVFKTKTGANLEFRSLTGGNKIILDDLSDTIRIRADVPNAFTTIQTQSGNVEANTNLGIVLQGGNNLDVTSLGNRITIDTTLEINNILLNLDFGPIGDIFDNAVQFNTSNSNVDFGTITLPGRLDLDLGNII